MITEIRGKCMFEGCDLDATEIACGREPYEWQEWTGHPEPALYCLVHAEKVVNENDPEYRESCPNCSCYFGVN